MTASKQKSEGTIFFLILVLPFLILYWLVPFLSNLSIGNDYQSYPLENQMELFFSMKTGSFPLYSPGYALGQTSMALAWSQVFHPIAYLAALMPGYWSGKALLWYTFFKLLSLGFTQLVLFRFLRELRIKTVFSFLISLITVYNLRMLDMLRFGPALEAYTAHLVLCAAIGWYFIHPSRLLGPLGIIFSTYLLVVSGHPQMMYYGLLGSGLFLLVAPLVIPDILAEKPGRFKEALLFWGKSGIFIGIGIVLSAAYILPFYFDFYVTNAGRVGSSYEWSSQGTQSFFGVLSNFFIPFLSDVHGAFGGAFILALATLLPVLRCFRIRIPRSVWIIWGIVLFLFLYMLGQRTPIHRLAWEYLPFMSAFRNPGRISMIIPVFLMMLLAWVVKSEEPIVFPEKHPIKLTPYGVLASIALLFIPLYALIFILFRPQLGFLPPIALHKIPLVTLAFIMGSGIVSLMLLIAYSTYQRISHAIGIILCAAVIFQTGALLRYGTFITPAVDRPTFEQMMSEKREKLDYRHHDLPGMQNAAVITQLDHTFIEPFLGKIFTQIIPVKSQADGYDRMARARLPQQLFIEGYDPEEARIITETSRHMKEGKVELTYSSFNRLVFHVSSQERAFFGLSYPYTGNWRAWVNGKRTFVYRANGAANAVEIPEGQSIVEFRYWSSAFFWGMLISCAVFTIIGVTACFRGLKGIPRITGVALIIIASSGIFMLWYSSLYNGDNLHTEYYWTYTPPAKKPNLAYGKKTSGYELSSTSYLQYHRSRAVDGDIRPGSGFTFKPGDGKVLIIDLSRNEEIQKILLYGKSDALPFVAYSQNGDLWNDITSFISREENPANIFQINFKKPVHTRFIKVKASGSRLSIDELEVYGPEKTK